MRQNKLLARRESFGYLLFDPDLERITVLDSNDAIDFSQNLEIIDSISRSVVKGSDVHLLPSVVERSDILCAPTYVELYPTLACNERCYFCYVGDKLNNNLPSMNVGNIPQLIKTLANHGVFQIFIAGGEPFLYRDLGLLIDNIYKENLFLSISTNGTVDRPEVWDAIISASRNTISTKDCSLYTTTFPSHDCTKHII
ncbi:MAG: radical SAM protein [Thermoproteota archaeon]|nr:radical SAM protein [Thermoproteota archaeon]